MKITFEHQGQLLTADLSGGHNIAIPLRDGPQNPNCFYAPIPTFEPYRSGDFVGSLEAGAPVNFYNVRFNPHGSGTHTECLGHIAKGDYTIARALKKHHFMAQLVTLWPILQENGDRVITLRQVQELVGSQSIEALVIRTMPNTDDKLVRNYGGTNPPYLEAAACAYLADAGVEHLLLDLPSVDREEDGGAMAAHKAWWKVNETQPRLHATITEMIFVPDYLLDGKYLLNLQVARFELDAAPSQPMLYDLGSLNK
jgi:arylformamidase